MELAGVGLNKLQDLWKLAAHKFMNSAETESAAVIKTNA
jgi:hypothetical protein